MKKYKYVVEAGCSYTATNAKNLVNPGETYGDIVANHYGAKCYNLAMSGGSFQRMGRKIYQWCAKNKDKFNDTLIILGMTSLGRLEIWNNKLNSWHNDSEHFQPPNSLFDQFKDHLMIYWTAEQRKNYFVNFYNDNAEFLLATNIIIGLQSFLTLNNIDHVFFDAIESTDKFWERHCDDMQDILGHKLIFDNLVSQENWYRHPEYESMLDFTKKNPEMRVTETDVHPNKKAHKYWGECLLEYIEELI